MIRFSTTVLQPLRVPTVPRLGPFRVTDHAIPALTPTYREKLKTVKPVFRTVDWWGSGKLARLYMDCTDWEAFKHAGSSLDEYTDVVTSYISFCEDLCVCFPGSAWSLANDKPWFRKLVQVRIVGKYMRRVWSGAWANINRPSQAHGGRFVEPKHMQYRKRMEAQLPLTTLVMFGRAYRMSLGKSQRPPRKFILGLIWMMN